MKKKAISILLALVCSVVCAFSLTACGNKDNDPYYGRTYTLTGKCVIDWENKFFYDNYEQDYSKNYSQKELLEKHWDKIDWNKTFEMNYVDVEKIPAHDSAQEFMQSFKEFEESGLESLAGLKISVSGKNNPTLTLSFTEEMMQFSMINEHYDAEITMPFCETNEQFAANKPFNNEDSYQRSFDTPGYSGIGVYKTEDNHVLTVDFSVEKYVKNIHLTIVDYEVNASGNNIGQQGLLRDEMSAITLYDADGSTILDIRFFIDFEVSKNK